MISAFAGHAVSLFRVLWAAEVLETAYNDYATARQRYDIVTEFYGREFVLFEVGFRLLVGLTCSLGF